MITEESEKDAKSQKVLLAGLPFTYAQISALLTRAKAEMPLRPVKFPILGEYKDCFSGEEFVAWLLENVPDFQKDLDLVLTAARDLTERHDLLRKLGEFGNNFENANDVFYQFRPKVPLLLSLDRGYTLISRFSGFYAWSATFSQHQIGVPTPSFTLATHRSGTRKDFWYIRRHREQGMGFKRRTPLHSA